MKKTILTYAMTGVIAMTAFSVVGQENKKAGEAREDLLEAQNDLREAKVDSAADFQKFKAEAELKISENDATIATLKEKSWNENKDTEQKYEEKVVVLQQKNDLLKKKIKESDGTKTSKWSSFKREFNHDMDDLGRAIKDVGVDNTK
ncbi:MAG TPA: hypothetical protein VFW11_09945 [Cyclobacteriaceae bacterium]|nr:hypothetical protein [Cyclobacteriaceae bacterium]